MTLESTLGTALLSLCGVALLIGLFYVLATGKLSSLWQGGSDERYAAPGRREWHGKPSHRVVLHNDDHTDMARVVGLLGSITGINRKLAFSKMYEAHTKGSAVVLLCSEEAASDYGERLRSEGLDVTVEPD